MAEIRSHCHLNNNKVWDKMKQKKEKTFYSGVGNCETGSGYEPQ